MKKLIVAASISIFLSALVAVFWYALTPHTPEQYHERLQKQLGKVAQGDAAGFEDVFAEYEHTQKVFEENFPETDLMDNLAFEKIEIVDQQIGDASRALALYQDFTEKMTESEFVPKSLYRTGEILLDQKKYLPATDSFRELVLRFPEHELAAEAQYKVGMIYNEIKEHSVALRELRKMVEDYPEHPKAAKAQLKVADILSEQMKNQREAMKELKSIQTKYPGSSEAMVAGGKEKEIGQEQSEDEEEEYEKERYGDNLYDHTRAWQQQREDALIQKIAAQGLDIVHYDLWAHIEPENATMQARVVMSFVNGASAAKEFTFQLSSFLEVDTVALFDSAELPAEDMLVRSTPLVFKHEADVIACRMPNEIAAGEQLHLYFEYEGKWAAGFTAPKTIEGSTSAFLTCDSKWYPFTVWGDIATCKGTYESPEDYRILSNGVFNGEQVQDGFRLQTWVSSLPMFGITLSCAPYKMLSREVTLGGRTFPIQCFTVPEHSGSATAVLDEVESILDFYSYIFCPFPYEILKIAESSFPGGYGSSTLVLLNSSAFEGEPPRWLLAHEISHQWWGNLVGINLAGDDTSIPWQTEGFATYSDIMYTEHKEGIVALQNHVSKYATMYYEHATYGADEPIQTVNMRSPMYQAITYQKGSMVLHALRYIMGDDAFLSAMKEYAERYSFKTTVVDDFRKVCEEFYEPEQNSPGYPERDLSWFFEQWLERESFPILKIEEVKITPDDLQYIVDITIEQQEQIYNIPIDLLIRGVGERKMERIWLSQKQGKFTYTLSWTPRTIKIDPKGWILKDPGSDLVMWEVGK